MNRTAGNIAGKVIVILAAVMILMTVCFLRPVKAAPSSEAPAYDGSFSSWQQMNGLKKTPGMTLSEYSRQRKLFIIDTNAPSAVGTQVDINQDSALAGDIAGNGNGTSADHTGDFSSYANGYLDNGVMNIPYFDQNKCFWENGRWTHTEWAYVTFEKYPDRSIPTSGCGYVACAMALTYLTDQLVAPVDLMNNGTYNYNSGMSYDGGVICAQAYGVSAHTTNDPDEAYNAIKDGYPVMVIEGGLPWTDQGHYILCIGVIDDGRVAVNDPKDETHSYMFCKALWNWSDIADPAKYNTERAFTIFGK